MNQQTVEDLIEILSGLSNLNCKFDIQSSDQNLMFSLGKQCIRQIPFTDRQYDLAKRKILDYKNQLQENGITHIEEKMNRLRHPLRSIDRSRTIKIENYEGLPMIAVRFPFAKNMIKYIETLTAIHKNKGYVKQTKTHYVRLTEKNIYKVVGNFQKANFEIEESLKETYRKLLEMTENKKNFVPGIYGLKLKNLHNKAFDYAISSIGEPNIDNLALFKDRQDVIGLDHFDESDLTESVNKLQTLTKKLIHRKKYNVLINSTKYSFNNVVESILELHRFPLLVILPDTDESLTALGTVYESFKGIVLDDSCTVMFRKENKTELDKQFNQYIKQKNLNNSLANSSKIVYINNNKLPKPLLASDWKPSAILLMGGSRRISMKLTALTNECDLVIHYDSDKGMFGYQDIEEV